MKEKITKILDITFWKFVLVGIINTLVGTTVMFVAYNFLHFSYWVSSASNYVVGSIVSYFLNKYFTFQNNEKISRTVIQIYFEHYSMLSVGLWTGKASCFMDLTESEQEYSG